MLRLTKQHRFTGIAILTIAGMMCGCGQTAVIPNQSSNIQQIEQPEQQASTARTTETASTIDDTKTQPELNWTDFPFMKATDSVVAVMSPAMLAKSASVSKLIAAIPLEDVSLTIPPSETAWVAVYANPLVNADNSLTDDATMVIRLNRPSSAFEIAESRFADADLQEVSNDKHHYLRVSGLTQHTFETTTDADGHVSEVSNFDSAPDMAVFEYDESTYVVCQEARLPYVLDPADTDGDLRKLVADTTATSPLFFATSLKGRTILKEAVVSKAAEIQEGGVLQILAANAQQLILTIDADSERLLHMSVLTAGAEQAAELKTAIAAAVESGSQFLTQMTFLESPQTASLFSLARNTLSGVSATTSDSVIIVSVVNPGNLTEAFSALETLLGMEVSSAGNP